MSDTPRGPGWWQATDGRWYPPAPTTPADHKQQVRERKLAVRRAKARAQVQGLLEPGEQIRAMFVSQTGPSPRGVATVGLTANLVRYWNVAVTDRNIVLSPMEAFGGKGSKRYLRRLPRAPIEILEAPSRHAWLPVEIAGTRHWVGRESYGDVVAANDALRGPVVQAPPPPPPPPPPPRPAAPAPAWYPDPGARHQLRYWDGSAWTDAVSDGGVRGTDPLVAA